MFIFTVGTVVTIACMVIIAVIYAWIFLGRFFKQLYCRHPAVYERMDGNVVCRHCDKNLGFVGTYRKKHPKSRV